MSRISNPSGELTNALRSDGQTLINNTKQLLSDMFESETKVYVVEKVKKAALVLGLTIIVSGAAYAVVKMKSSGGGGGQLVGFLPAQ
jgi:hypothetical protein